MLLARPYRTLLWPHGLKLPDSSVQGVLQARILEWVALSFAKGNLPGPGIEPASPALAGSFFYRSCPWLVFTRNFVEESSSALQKSVLMLGSYMRKTVVETLCFPSEWKSSVRRRASPFQVLRKCSFQVLTPREECPRALNSSLDILDARSVTLRSGQFPRHKWTPSHTVRPRGRTWWRFGIYAVFWEHEGGAGAKLAAQKDWVARSSDSVSASGCHTRGATVEFSWRCLICYLFRNQSCAGVLQPRGRQPTRLPSPWDSPGKNAGVGFPFLSPGNLPHPVIEPVSLALAGAVSNQGSPLEVCRPSLMPNA